MFSLSIVTVDRAHACTVPLLKGEGDVCECCNYRVIRLLSVLVK